MATPSREAIETFVRITGASESVAVRKLEEYGGNLDGAINAHFMEDERQFPALSSQYGAASPRYEFGDTTVQRQSPSRGIFPLLSAARSFRPSLLLDPNYRRNLYNQIGASVSGRHNPQYVHPGEFNYGYGQPYSVPRPVEEENANSSSHLHQYDGNVLRTHEDHNDIEEQIMQHAIEASKQESQPSQEEDELVRALSLSLKTAEQENEIRAQLALEDQITLESKELVGTDGKMKDSKFQTGSSSSQHGAQNSQEQTLWGGMSSKELDEAMLLETALYGENSFQPSSNLKSGSDQNLHRQQESYHPSPSLVNQRQLREQQDNEYMASLLADREKEMKKKKEKEKSDSEKPESSDCNKVEASNKELERLLASKEASLPREPEIGDENAVTLLVRLPDGSRCSRRFLKSDKLKYLFDFIDTGRVVKPQTYNLVRPYPRRIISTSDGSLSLSRVGLTNKQEALFLEMI